MKPTLAGSLLVVALSACGATATRTPSPMESATPAATDIATATPAPVTPTAAWTKLGEINAQGRISTLIGFERGYIAVESIGDPAATWYSPDGASWEMTTHSTPVAPCPGWSERPNLESMYSGATDGKRVVIVATILDSPTRSACDEMQLTSLRTSDGATWERSDPFGVGWAESAWYAAGRFGARSNDGTTWRSDDGLAWEAAMTDSYVGLVIFRVSASADAATLLAVTGPAEDGQALMVSTGTEPWAEVHRLPQHYSVAAVLPAIGDEPWVVAASDNMPSDDPASLLFSDDLQSWRTTAFPRSGIGPLIRTSNGLIAIGFDFSATAIIGCMDNCPSPNRAVYWSADGSQWVELASSDEVPVASGLPSGFVNGPSGIIGIQPNPEGVDTVWRLTLD